MAGPIDPALLQPFADRLAGLPKNGHVDSDFPEPLATLWRDFDADAKGDLEQVAVDWATGDQVRLALLMDILRQQSGGAPAVPPDPWQIRTLKDAYLPRPPLEFAVEDLIVLPGLVMIYGAPGSLKSMVTADMLVCIAGGVEWLQPLDPKDKTARATLTTGVLWLDFDNGVRRTDERFEALARTRGLPDTVPIHYVSMPNPWLDLSDTGSVDELKKRIVRLAVRVVAVDNLGTIAGAADENSAEMIRIMGALRNIVEECQVTVIVLHHQRKSSAAGGRTGDTIRGHSSIEAALDLALLVEREEHSDDVTIKSTKSRDIDVHPFGARWDFLHRAGTKELETARFYGVLVEDKTSNAAIEMAIEDALNQKRPRNQSDLRAAVKAQLAGVGDNRIRSRIVAMVKLGTLVERRQQAKNSALYDLP